MCDVGSRLRATVNTIGPLHPASHSCVIADLPTWVVADLVSLLVAALVDVHLETIWKHMKTSSILELMVQADPNGRKQMEATILAATSI